MSALRDFQNFRTPERIEEQPEFFLLNFRHAIWKLVVPGLILFVMWILLSGVMNG